MQRLANEVRQSFWWEVAGYGNWQCQSCGEAKKAFKRIWPDYKTKNIKVSNDLNSDLAQSGVVRETIGRKRAYVYSKRVGMECRYTSWRILGMHSRKVGSRLVMEASLSRGTASRAFQYQIWANRKGDEIYLQLSPGESCFLIGSADGKDAPVVKNTGKHFNINGTWDLAFIKGQPKLPLLPQSSNNWYHGIRFRIPLPFSGRDAIALHSICLGWKHM